MSHHVNADFVADRAAKYNLDELLDVFVSQNEPKKLRRELLALYFRLVNAFGDGGECLGGFYSDALCSLQTIIEAVDVMEEPGGNLKVVDATR